MSSFLHKHLVSTAYTHLLASRLGVFEREHKTWLNVCTTLRCLRGEAIAFLTQFLHRASHYYLEGWLVTWWPLALSRALHVAEECVMRKEMVLDDVILGRKCL